MRHVIPLSSASPRVGTFSTAILDTHRPTATTYKFESFPKSSTSPSLLLPTIPRPRSPHRHRSLKLNPAMLRIAGEKLIGTAARAAPLSVLRRSYHERVVDHYNNPRNVGSFEKDDPAVGTGLVGAPACGDVMKLQIKVDDASGKIVDARFKTFGCGSAIASSSVATEWVKGRKMEDVISIKNTEIAKHLALPPVKLHCSMLAEDAIKAAVKDYEAKLAKSNGSPDASSKADGA